MPVPRWFTQNLDLAELHVQGRLKAHRQAIHLSTIFCATPHSLNVLNASVSLLVGSLTYVATIVRSMRSAVPDVFNVLFALLFFLCLILFDSMTGSAIVLERQHRQHRPAYPISGAQLLPQRQVRNSSHASWHKRWNGSCPLLGRRRGGHV